MNEGTVFDRIPPHNQNAERAVLGACLLDREALIQITEILTPEDFYDLNHRNVFQAISEMVQADKPVDPVTLMDELNRQGLGEKLGGQAFIASVIDTVPTTANAEYHAMIVREKAIHRRLISVGNSIVRMGYSEDRDIEELLEEAERAVFKISQRRNDATFKSVGDVLVPTFKNIEEQYKKSDQDVTGVQTGFCDIDNRMGGLQPGNLIILAARPSMGKTALAINIAQNVGVRQNEPVLIFSLEMSAEQLVQRMLGAEARVNIHDLRTGGFASNAWKDLTDAAATLAKAPIYIDDSSMLTTMELRARCRRFKAKHNGLGLIVVDYLQLLSFARRIDSKQQEVAEISRALKGVARELEVPVIALSQLSRAVESRTDKVPQLSDLRDSGAIEQDADIVAMLYRAGYYESNPVPGEEDNTANVIIAKHRNGPTGNISLVFQREFTRFVNYGKNNSF